jgi:N utilization substance protein B
MLYGRDIGGISDGEILRSWRAMDEISPPVREFAEQLFTGVAARIEEIDRLIQEHAQNWRLGRMAAVDRNVLRLAAFELMSGGKSPDSAIINEAIELARKFSTQDAAQFVNGILDSIRKNLPGNNYKNAGGTPASTAL